MTLVNQGLYPETLPPCFASYDASRAFRGIIGDLDAATFQTRSSQYIRYNGTKHDGNRRFFGSPNIVSYFYVSTFIHKHWTDFENRFKASPYSLSAPSVMPEGGERAIKVASLSELSEKASKKLSYAPVILKTDISQYFPSIYTHSISWSMHGREKAKADPDRRSKDVYFNLLDFHTMNCQSAQTRGVLIGPDAFRLIAEFISSGIDIELQKAVGELIVGAVRHVDDYYIGLRSETDGLVVLSKLREILAQYELQLNDTKTRIYGSLEPINDLWAQQIRKNLSELRSWDLRVEQMEFALDSSFDLARRIASDSPVKMVLRSLDQLKIYSSESWGFVESYLQRILHYHPHAIDYVCLIVVKRNSIDEGIDFTGWGKVANYLIEKHIPFNNHHEIIWLMWMMLCCELDFSDRLVMALEKVDNAHVQALLVQAFLDGRVDTRPKIRFTKRLPSTNDKWLLNLVARSGGFTKASFGGDMAAEFEHLASRKIRLVDIDGYVKFLAKAQTKAISRTRYGYDDEEQDGDVFGWPEDDEE
ncbi:RNA-directed DNA polymerase [Mesorhizobium sp. M0589]|uniref:RNA-directed DNA polymerase n=1 Tax=Mesorhizobium sp. M0589 TaxID=2956965 RepID=UPI0033367EA7